MTFSELPLKPAPRALRQFAAAWLALFLVLGVRALRHGHSNVGGGLLVVALAGVAGFLKPSAIRWLHVGAMMAAFPLGWPMTQLMLAIMFYLVLTPVALIFRWRGRDELQRRCRPEQASFWV